MKRSNPFALAIVGTLVAVGLTFLLIRARVIPTETRKPRWRRALDRVSDTVADAMKEARR